MAAAAFRARKFRFTFHNGSNAINSYALTVKGDIATKSYPLDLTDTEVTLSWGGRNYTIAAGGLENRGPLHHVELPLPSIDHKGGFGTGQVTDDFFNQAITASTLPGLKIKLQIGIMRSSNLQRLNSVLAKE